MKESYELRFMNLLKKYDIQVKADEENRAKLKRLYTTAETKKACAITNYIIALFLMIIQMWISDGPETYLCIAISVFGMLGLFIYRSVKRETAEIKYLESRQTPAGYIHTSDIKNIWKRNKTDNLCSVKKMKVPIKIKTLTRRDETGEVKAVMQLFAPKTPVRIPFFQSMHGKEGPQTTMCSEKEIAFSEQTLSILKNLPDTMESTFLVMELFQRYGGWRFLLPVGKNWQLLEMQMDDLCRLVIQDIMLNKLRNAVDSQALLEKKDKWQDFFISMKDIAPYFTKNDDSDQTEFWERNDVAKISDNITAYIDDAAANSEGFGISVKA